MATLPNNASLARVVRTVNDINGGTAGGPGVTSSGRSTAIRHDPAGRVLTLVGKVVTAGPKGEPDFKDNRYWVQVERNDISKPSGSTPDQLDELNLEDRPKTSDGKAQIITAYRLDEYDADSHDLANLQDDVYVTLVPTYSDHTDGQQMPRIRWLIVPPVQPYTFWARIDCYCNLDVNRWKYSFTEMRRAGDGSDKWVEVKGGRTGDCCHDSHYALNSIEAENVARGIQGNGIDDTQDPPYDEDGDAKVYLIPARGFPVVEMRPEYPKPTGSGAAGSGGSTGGSYGKARPVVYSFSYVNQSRDTLWGDKPTDNTCCPSSSGNSSSSSSSSSSSCCSCIEAKIGGTTHQMQKAGTHLWSNSDGWRITLDGHKWSLGNGKTGSGGSYHVVITGVPNCPPMDPSAWTQDSGGDPLQSIQCCGSSSSSSSSSSTSSSSTSSNSSTSTSTSTSTNNSTGSGGGGGGCDCPIDLSVDTSGCTLSITMSVGSRSITKTAPIPCCCGSNSPTPTPTPTPTSTSVSGGSGGSFTPPGPTPSQGQSQSQSQSDDSGDQCWTYFNVDYACGDQSFHNFSGGVGPECGPTPTINGQKVTSGQWVMTSSYASGCGYDCYVSTGPCLGSNATCKKADAPAYPTPGCPSCPGSTTGSSTGSVPSTGSNNPPSPPSTGSVNPSGSPSADPSTSPSNNPSTGSTQGSTTPVYWVTNQTYGCGYGWTAPTTSPYAEKPYNLPLNGWGLYGSVTDGTGTKQCNYMYTQGPSTTQPPAPPARTDTPADCGCPSSSHSTGSLNGSTPTPTPTPTPSPTPTPTPTPSNSTSLTSTSPSNGVASTGNSRSDSTVNSTSLPSSMVSAFSLEKAKTRYAAGIHVVVPTEADEVRSAFAVVRAKPWCTGVAITGSTLFGNFDHGDLDIIVFVTAAAWADKGNLDVREGVPETIDGKHLDVLVQPDPTFSPFLKYDLDRRTVYVPEGIYNVLSVPQDATVERYDAKASVERYQAARTARPTPPRRVRTIMGGSRPLPPRRPCNCRGGR